VKKKKKKKFKLTKDILFIDYEGKTNHEQEVVKNNDINNKKNKKREHTSSR
jgi:hypothetical protein